MEQRFILITLIYKEFETAIEQAKHDLHAQIVAAIPKYAERIWTSYT